jgi:aquaporin Z
VARPNSPALASRLAPIRTIKAVGGIESGLRDRSSLGRTIAPHDCERRRTGKNAKESLPMNIKPVVAEFVGTFMLMSAVLGAAFYSFGAPSGAAGILGVALSIGLTVGALIRSIGHISGGHYNPAVTLGLAAAGRFHLGDAVLYIAAQCLGAVAATAVFAIIGHAPASYAANGFGDLSMIKAGLLSVFLIEFLLTAFLLIVIMGSTRAQAPAGFAPFSIGLTLTAIHLMAIPVSNASVNPARSLGSAVFAGGEALSQLWVFWVAPILGGVAGALVYKWLDDEA